MKKHILLLLPLVALYFSGCSLQTKVSNPVSNTNPATFGSNSTVPPPQYNEGSIEIKVRDKENNPVISTFQVRNGEWSANYVGSIKYNFICLQNATYNSETLRTGSGPTYGTAPSSSENVMKKVCFTLNNSIKNNDGRTSSTLDPQPLKVETYQVGSQQGASDPDIFSMIKINEDGADDFVFDLSHTYGSITIDKAERQGNAPLVSVAGKVDVQDQNFRVTGNFKVLMKQR